TDAVLAGDVRGVAVEVGLHHPGGAEGRDPLGGPQLAGEAGAGALVAAEFHVQQFDGGPLAVLVDPEKDDALPALADPSGQPERPQLGGIAGNERRGLRHSTSLCVRTRPDEANLSTLRNFPEYR